jgi:hypothetical protein
MDIRLLYKICRDSSRGSIRLLIYIWSTEYGVQSRLISVHRLYGMIEWHRRCKPSISHFKCINFLLYGMQMHMQTLANTIAKR